MYYFLQHSEKAEKWPNGRTILFLADSFKKGQIATLFVTDDGTESRRSRDELQKKIIEPTSNGFTSNKCFLFYFERTFALRKRLYHFGV